MGKKDKILPLNSHQKKCHIAIKSYKDVQIICHNNN